MKHKIKLLDQIIENRALKIVFQPIISLKNGEVLGYEALSRTTEDTDFKNIEELFAVAKESNRLWDLERLSRTKTLEAARSFMTPPFNKKLFMNVSPQIMTDQEFGQELAEFFLREFRISPHNIIFEITEQNVIDNLKGLQSTLSQYKSDNYKFAIDDAGVEYSGLSTISDVEPNYIKIDMKLIRNIHQESIQSAIVKGMVEFSKLANVALIAEGIENIEEMETVTRLGVQYAQGYYIQKPKKDILDIDSAIKRQIRLLNQTMIKEERNKVHFTPIKHLCEKTRIITPDTRTIDAYEAINRNVNCAGLCVVENHKPVGIITKENMALKLSGRYGFTLYQNKPISKIMDTEFLAVDSETPVNIVAELAMERPQNKLYDFVVVTEDDKYMGTVTIKKMLQKATELEVSSARQQSPLTGLPGNMAIEQKLNAMIKEGTDFTATYLDIDHFKTYNDVYGFESGDLIIKLLARILKEHVPADQFIGHIGGDDFLVLLDYHLSTDPYEDIVQLFEKEVLKFYSLEDREKGFIRAKNRYGIMEDFPLISVTAVTIDNQKQTYKSTNEVSEELAFLKNRVKQEKSTPTIQ